MYYIAHRQREPPSRTAKAAHPSGRARRGCGLSLAHTSPKHHQHHSHRLRRGWREGRRDAAPRRTSSDGGGDGGDIDVTRVRHGRDTNSGLHLDSDSAPAVAAQPTTRPSQEAKQCACKLTRCEHLGKGGCLTERLTMIHPTHPCWRHRHCPPLHIPPSFGGLRQRSSENPSHFPSVPQRYGVQNTQDTGHIRRQTHWHP